ncbi:hypothetical protein ABBQ38_004343 [Trebouxia sp. C0009 RCD-2024]
MTDHQAAADTLKAALGSRSARLTEQDYRNLIEQGFDSLEALLDAREKTLEASLTRPVAVDSVLAWQAENKPSSGTDRGLPSLQRLPGHPGGIRSDADVAWMRQLLQETADIKLWPEERKMNVCKLPLLALIYHNDMSWRSYRMFFRDPSMATSKQTYYDLSTMLLKVAATLPDALVKSKVTHLMRCSGTVQLAAAACSMDVLRVWGRWARSEGVVGKSYLPKSPLSALPATGILTGFGADFMSNHAFGRGTVAVPVLCIDTLVPQARFILQAVRVRNRMRIGKPDLSGQHTVESVLYLAETFWQSSPFMLQKYGLGWWALQLPAVRVIVGSAPFRQFKQQVISAELECRTRPLSPQLTEAFDKISKQVCSLSEQVAHLQLSMDSLKPLSQSHLLAKLDQAEASFEQLANCNLAGLNLPAQTIGTVQDGLPDSTVRLMSALEGRTKACRKLNPRTAAVAVSLPPVVPQPAAQPSRKKHSFAELLTMLTRRTQMLLLTMLMFLPVVLLTILSVQAVLLSTVARPVLLLAAQRFLALVQSGLPQSLPSQHSSPRDVDVVSVKIASSPITSRSA